MFTPWQHSCFPCMKNFGQVVRFVFVEWLCGAILQRLTIKQRINVRKNGDCTHPWIYKRSAYFFDQRLSSANENVLVETSIPFQRQGCHSPRKGMRHIAEPLSVTLTGSVLMASFITASNDSTHSVLEQFHAKALEISQCAENEVSTSTQPSNSDVVLRLNTNLT